MAATEPMEITASTVSGAVGLALRASICERAQRCHRCASFELLLPCVEVVPWRVLLCCRRMSSQRRLTGSDPPRLGVCLPGCLSGWWWCRPTHAIHFRLPLLPPSHLATFESSSAVPCPITVSHCLAQSNESARCCWTLDGRFALVFVFFLFFFFFAFGLVLRAAGPWSIGQQRQTTLTSHLQQTTTCAIHTLLPTTSLPPLVCHHTPLHQPQPQTPSGQTQQRSVSFFSFRRSPLLHRSHPTRQQQQQQHRRHKGTLRSARPHSLFSGSRRRPSALLSTTA